jgi:hypothetical protein
VAKFWLGTHKAGWLWREDVTLPLCVSRRTLAHARRLRPATSPFIYDSGAFTELSRAPEGERARWRISQRDYVAETARVYHGTGGMMAWAATRDMMCEPEMIHGGRVGMVTVPGTGQSVAEHQWWTLADFIGCTDLWPQYSDAPCPYVPTLQGWSMGEYLWHRDAYTAAGIDLAAYPAVGLGSVCRRSGTLRAGIIAMFLGLPNLHGFGVKLEGLDLHEGKFASTDSAAWSYDAYRAGVPLPGCTHQTCSNCPRFAALWYERMLAQIEHRDVPAPPLPTGRVRRRVAAAS